MVSLNFITTVVVVALVLVLPVVVLVLTMVNSSGDGGTGVYGDGSFNNGPGVIGGFSSGAGVAYSGGGGGCRGTYGAVVMVKVMLVNQGLFFRMVMTLAEYVSHGGDRGVVVADGVGSVKRLVLVMVWWY